ncbi:Peptidase P60 [Oceanicaulis sp. 350]|nr:Peptidase P60 [Oceanicaulis sp. 350]
MTELEHRSRILREARSWTGTPYHHQMSVKGAGCDCLGLVRGVWRALYGPEPQTLPPYTPDWAERSARDLLSEAAARWLSPVQIVSAAPGDVLLFHYSPNGPARHCAILSAPDRMLHAWRGQRVCETALGPWWRRRIAGAYAFPLC